MNPPVGKKEDKGLKEAVLAQVKDNELPCALAFDIAKKLDAPPGDVGAMADALGVRLSKCQMGLFGYKPKKKIVKAKDTSNQDLIDAVKASVQQERLPCAEAWKIAERFRVPKLKVGNVAEAHGIKIKYCQLGAF